MTPLVEVLAELKVTLVTQELAGKPTSNTVANIEWMESELERRRVVKPYLDLLFPDPDA